MKPRKSLSVYVLLVGILGLLIVAGFFTFQIVDEATKSQIPAEQRELVKPIDGAIEQRVIDNLQTRRTFSREEILVSPMAIPSITISPTVAIVATASSEAAVIKQ
ncbi:hypothetical protein A2572_02085 [Candidatus Collierbacteria bacterium RIFOXYD1_FULL_40_9]|uniref:Uncharacterized protein n=1 Tax=Candidatus Collierbacteria bacterium RIFOXYD1_FULL_40_9 TaxID=1817731 RepID=A0A1F5FTC3_9BACT|nr:MAG: hypothetical protein A2572_02085 [Candidatus Collierbacteria bacterium RIFOXYD1_FULL_40_9]